MRRKLIEVMGTMCRQQRLGWSVFDDFVDNTFDNSGDSELLVELMLLAGTDYIRIIREAMGL